MKSVLEIWEDFKNGDISRNEADKLMKATVKTDEKQVVKHNPGRYDQSPYYTIEYQNGSAYKVIIADREGCRIIGDCCETSEEAEKCFKQKKAYLTLIDKIHELNDGWTPDWVNSNQEKYYFYFDHNDKQLGQNHNCIFQYLKSELYFKQEVYGQTVQALGAALIKLAIGI